MVLSDREIWEEIRKGELVFDPPLEPEQVSPSSIDLGLGNTFAIFEPHITGAEITVDISQVINIEEICKRYSKEIHVDDDKTIELKRGEFILSFTREYIKLPKYLAARIEGRSSLARLGLTVHQTAPTVHATFEGQLRLEICNNGPFVCKLKPGLRVCQLILERLGKPAKSSLISKYQKQREKRK